MAKHNEKKASSNSSTSSRKGKAAALKSRVDISSRAGVSRGVEARARRAIKAPNGKIYVINAVKCLRGGLYVRINDGDAVAFVPEDQFAGSSGDAMQTLRSAGVIIIGSKIWTEIRDAVSTFRKSDYQRRPLLDRSGWTKGYFALPDGQVFSPPGKKKAETLFPLSAGLCRRKGKLDVWKRKVPMRLAGQHIPSFLLMMPYAAPLLELGRTSGNFAFEISGSAGKGKSTIQQIMASTAGYPFPSANGHFGMSMNATVNGLELAMLEYSDLVMPLEEATLFDAGGTASSRANSLLELVFRSSDGTTKSRATGAKQKMIRFIPVISGNEAIADVLGRGRAKVNLAAADRLITLPLSDDRPFGIFDFMPDRFANGGELAEALKRTIGRHYGLALPRFLVMLVKRRSENPAKLRRFIKRNIASFRRRLGVDYNDGSTSRVADAFGLICAAGLLAKQFKILPEEFSCFAAAKACYQLHLGSARLLPPFKERLVTLAGRADAVNLDRTGLQKMTVAQRDGVAAYLRTNRSCERELLLTTNALKRAFPDWGRIKDDADVREMLKPARKRLKVKRPLRSNSKDDWVYCFVLPDVV